MSQSLSDVFDVLLKCLLHSSLEIRGARELGTQCRGREKRRAALLSSAFSAKPHPHSNALHDARQYAELQMREARARLFH